MIVVGGHHVALKAEIGILVLESLLIGSSTIQKMENDRIVRLKVISVCESRVNTSISKSPMGTLTC